MIRNIILSLIIALPGYLATFSQTLSVSGYYPRGTVREGQSMKSTILGRDVNYAIYLPPGYDASSRRYPVVYLLHGFSDDETAWIQYGEITETADRAIANREIPPMIIVMPDAKVSWYVNDVGGKEKYEDMAFREFIPYIDVTYRTRAAKEFRAVSGLSMGGYGSLVWSLHHPEMFSSCAAFSPGVFTDEEITNMPEKQYDLFFKNIFITSKNSPRVNEHWRQNSPADLMNTLPKEEVKKVRYYIDCGDDDFLYRGNSTLHMIMRERDLPHEYRVGNGSHSWVYWRTHIIEGLKFIGEAFHR